MGLSAALLGGAAFGSTIYQGEQSARAQRKSLRLAEDETRAATARASAEQRRAEMADAKANQKQPNVEGLLSQSTLNQPTPTLLTQYLSERQRKPTLGQTSTLGA